MTSKYDAQVERMRYRFPSLSAGDHIRMNWKATLQVIGACYLAAAVLIGTAGELSGWRPWWYGLILSLGMWVHPVYIAIRYHRAYLRSFRNDSNVRSS